MSEPYRVKLRDRLACWLANWILNHLASAQYRAFVHVAVRRGLASLPGILASGIEQVPDALPALSERLQP